MSEIPELAMSFGKSKGKMKCKYELKRMINSVEKIIRTLKTRGDSRIVRNRHTIRRYDLRSNEGALIRKKLLLPYTFNNK